MLAEQMQVQRAHTVDLKRGFKGRALGVTIA
jgi:hypothetical protein